jgi:uncharacterized protein (TIGR03905 family)
VKAYIEIVILIARYTNCNINNTYKRDTKMTVYKTKGTCSREIRVDLEGKTIKSVQIIGGCDGNSKGLMTMLRGCSVEDTISRLEGITCDSKRTSCPDQIAKALKQALSESGVSEIDKSESN